MSSATDNLGSHLLGRLPSPPDARDFKLEDYLTVPSNADIQAMLDGAVGHLKLTTVGYAGHSAAWQAQTTTQWYQGLALIAQARAALGGTPPPPPSTDVVWADAEPVLDQGQYGTCVGNGCAQWGNTLPIDDKYTEGMGQSALTKGPYARALYYEATVLDGSPDDPDAPNGGQQGASPRSGVKALQNRGRLSTYASTLDIETMKTWVATKGPLIIGSDWTADMFTPNAQGYITPTGIWQGGHCWLVRGVLFSESAFLCRNSWGAGWGLSGDFKVKWTDFQTLMTGVKYPGECWTAAELP